MSKVNDFSISISTTNGSGSQSANNIILKSLFRMGLPVGGKNIFPSNIAGLPTQFIIRVNEKGFTGRQLKNDISISLNAKTFEKDVEQLNENAVIIHSDDIKPQLTSQQLAIPVPFKKISREISDSVKLRKLLTNIIYVGILADLLDIDLKVVEGVIQDNFKNKSNVIEENLKALQAGFNFSKENLDASSFPYKVKVLKRDDDEILIDGNTASALGLVYGGCSFMSWYPITPSSSLAESFESFSNQLKKDSDGKNKFAVVQAEDELSAISMVLGAGWMGARAVTPTSGPGLSLMAEAAGLSYFAEVPSVIWDVQRAGPSTGLPTRTMQCDLESAYKLSHGDSQHIVLLPGNVKECFEFGQIALDLAEQLQCLVIVLSDLDLGMNQYICKDFEYPKENFQRGKVISAEDLNKKSFARYKDIDDDGITYRTLPGTQHKEAAYFTRGTGHDEEALYSEDSENYQRLLDRLNKKHETAKKYIPTPEINKQSDLGIIFYGSSTEAMKEVMSQLAEENFKPSTMRVKALPLHKEAEDFIASCKKLFVVEQNATGQLCNILKSKLPEQASKFISIKSYNGLPLSSSATSKSLLSHEALK